MVEQMALIYATCRNKQGKHRSGYLTDSIPASRGHYRVSFDSAKIFKETEVAEAIEIFTKEHPGAVLISKSI